MSTPADDVLRAIADPNRRAILQLVADRELPAGAIAAEFQVTRPAISQHLAVLREARLVTERRVGTRRLYRSRPDGLAELQAFLAVMWPDALGRLKARAETLRGGRGGPTPPTTDTPATRRQADMTDVDSRKAAARRLYEEVFGLGNMEAADEILAADCVGHGPGMPPEPGTEAIKRQAALLRTAIPDLRVELEDQVAEGDRVASRWKATGTNTGPLRRPGGEIPPSGGPIEFTEIRIDRFDGDRIVESWFIPDRLRLWQQLGLVPGPG